MANWRTTPTRCWWVDELSWRCLASHFRLIERGSSHCDSASSHKKRSNCASIRAASPYLYPQACFCRTNCFMTAATGLWKRAVNSLLDMTHLLGVQRGTAQGFHVGLGADQRRSRRRVTQDLGDDVKGCLLTQQLRCQRMAQRVQTVPL